tara:strand:+ start:120256 stop:121467 length:1212 start_codon:yes stop_codon:yes gene_type:complete
MNHKKKMLNGKRVLLGITASIAAFKSAELIRLFKKSGAEIRVIQTKESTDFITPLTISTLSENKVLTEMVKDDSWNNHVKLGLWADLIIIAPLTANTLAKMANGECDNLLLATYLSAKCDVYFAPAMDLDMFKHPSTISNINKLENYGNILIPSGFGELASGLVGEGRMAEPSEIISHILTHLNEKLDLNNKKFLITAGPTHEKIDAVRYISNKSSGKMGIELALNAANRGGKIDLVLGPSSLEVNHSNINVYKVINAEDMFNTVNKVFDKSEISIFAAAVSDFTPKIKVNSKIKKNDSLFSLTLIKTKDILTEMSSIKRDDQFIVGFALETDDEIDNAITKLKDKNLDLIIMNSLNNKGAGFEHDTNKITIIDKDYNQLDFELKSKKEVANDIINFIISKNG